MQLVKGDYYYAQAESEQSSAASNNGNRGGIYFTDNNGNTLPAAIDQPFPLIYAVPTAVKNPATAAATFAPILNMSAAKLKAIFSRPGDQYELLVNKADPAVAQKVTGAEHSRRIYRDRAGAILSAVDVSRLRSWDMWGRTRPNTGQSGKYGLKKYYNGLLDGAFLDERRSAPT